MGLGISFSTLQDTTKTQNKISKIVYQNPKYAKIFIIYVILLTLFFLSFGLFGFLFSQNANMQSTQLEKKHRMVFAFSEKKIELDYIRNVNM